MPRGTVLAFRSSSWNLHCWRAWRTASWPLLRPSGAHIAFDAVCRFLGRRDAPRFASSSARDIRARARARTRARARARARARKRARARPRTGIGTFAHARAKPHPSILSHSRARVRACTCANMRVHLRAHARIRARTSARATAVQSGAQAQCSALAEAGAAPSEFAPQLQAPGRAVAAKGFAPGGAGASRMPDAARSHRRQGCRAANQKYCPTGEETTARRQFFASAEDSPAERSAARHWRRAIGTRMLRASARARRRCQTFGRGGRGAQGALRNARRPRQSLGGACRLGQAPPPQREQRARDWWPSARAFTARVVARRRSRTDAQQGRAHAMLYFCEKVIF